MTIGYDVLRQKPDGTYVARLVHADEDLSYLRKTDFHIGELETPQDVKDAFDAWTLEVIDDL